jgi:streptogramin lyase
VTLEGVGSNDIQEIVWQYGDGMAGQGTKLSHEFTTPGTYEVIATGKTADNKGATVTTTVTVTAPESVPLPAGPPELVGVVGGVQAPADFYVTDVAVDQQGKVYTTDWFYRTVSRYQADGSRDLKIRDTDSLGKPRRLTVDLQGNIYVSDPTFGYIIIYDATGTEINRWPVGGSVGPGNIKFLPPDRIAICYSIKQTVGIHALDGSLLLEFGDGGSTPGQFSGPMDLVRTADGGYWVVDKSGRVQKFDASGHYLQSFGSYGTSIGQFDLASAMDADSAGNLFILDRRINRVQKFDSQGHYLGTWGCKGSSPGEFSEPNGLAVGPDDTIWVAGYHGHDIQHFANDGTLLERWQGHLTGTGEFGYAAGVAVSGENLFVVDQINNNVQVFDRSSGAYRYQFGDRGEGSETVFNFPRAIATGPEGDLYITEDNLVRRIRPDGTFVALYNPANDSLSASMGIAVNSCGRYFQADSNNNAIVQRDIRTHAVISNWHNQGTASGQFTLPHGVALDGRGFLYVTDGDNRIQKLTQAGEFVKQWPTQTAVPGDLRATSGLAIDPSRGIAYAGTYPNEILAYDLEGEFLFRWKVQEPYNYGVFKFLAVDDRGVLYASDYRGAVYIFDYK